MQLKQRAQQMRREQETVFALDGNAVRISLVKMTPLGARCLLERNTNNRRLSPSMVEMICSDIRSGQWQFNGATISVDSEGRLLDGQHRLEAIAKSGISVPLLLIEGLAPKTMDSIDSGKKRTAGDVLGIDGVANSREVAAVSRILEQWSNNVPLSGLRFGVVSRSEILVFARDYAADIQWAIRVARPLRKELGVTVSAAASAAFIMKVQLGDSQVGFIEEFFGRITSGEASKTGDPAMAFRRFAVRQVTQSQNGVRADIWIEALMRCAAADRSGSSMKVVRLQGEFPEMLS